MNDRDRLTGLYTRCALEKQLGPMLAQARRPGGRVAVALLDVDHFKDFNILYGSRAGDALLRDIGRHLKAHWRRGTLLCRSGPDEFAVVLTDLSCNEDLVATLTSIVDEVRITRFRQAREPRFSASLGVAVIPEHGAGITELLQNAELALDAAQPMGFQQVRLFKTSMRSAIIERLQQTAAFRLALEAGTSNPFISHGSGSQTGMSYDMKPWPAGFDQTGSCFCPDAF